MIYAITEGGAPPYKKAKALLTPHRNFFNFSTQNCPTFNRWGLSIAFFC